MAAARARHGGPAAVGDRAGFVLAQPGSAQTPTSSSPGGALPSAKKAMHSSPAWQGAGPPETGQYGVQQPESAPQLATEAAAPQNEPF